MRPPYSLAKATRHLVETDPILGSVIERVGRCRLQISAEKTLFEALCRSIVYQQLSGLAAGAIFGRFEELVGIPVIPKSVLKFDETQLRSAGLSRAKARSVLDLADRMVRGELAAMESHKKLSNDEVSSLLTTVKGIGPWTAQMVLMFHLGRPDIFPVKDLAIRKACNLLYAQKKDLEPDEMEELATRWAPYRTVASWYLWRTLELDPLP